MPCWLVGVGGAAKKIRVAALIRCGELCKACGDKCRDQDGSGIELECPCCNGNGCDQCKDGVFLLTECPREYTRKLVTAVNTASLVSRGILPVQGGALDQANWFIEFLHELESNQAKIDEERAKKWQQT